MYIFEMDISNIFLHLIIPYLNYSRFRNVIEESIKFEPKRKWYIENWKKNVSCKETVIFSLHCDLPFFFIKCYNCGEWIDVPKYGCDDIANFICDNCDFFCAIKKYEQIDFGEYKEIITLRKEEKEKEKKIEYKDSFEPPREYYYQDYIEQGNEDEDIEHDLVYYRAQLLFAKKISNLVTCDYRFKNKDDPNNRKNLEKFVNDTYMRKQDSPKKYGLVLRDQIGIERHKEKNKEENKDENMCYFEVNSYNINSPKIPYPEHFYLEMGGVTLYVWLEDPDTGKEILELYGAD
jgi:hypothetical protein